MAQVAHAAGESSPGNLPSGTFAIVLGCPDAVALMQLADRLRIACVEFTCVFEPDEPWCGQLMAIGLRPARRSKVRSILSSLPLYQGAIAGVVQQGRLARVDAGLTPASGTNASVAQ